MHEASTERSQAKCMNNTGRDAQRSPNSKSTCCDRAASRGHLRPTHGPRGPTAFKIKQNMKNANSHSSAKQTRISKSSTLIMSCLGLSSRIQNSSLDGEACTKVKVKGATNRKSSSRCLFVQLSFLGKGNAARHIRHLKGEKVDHRALVGELHPCY